MVGDVKLEDVSCGFNMSEHLTHLVNSNHCGIVTVKIQEPYTPSWSIRLNHNYSCKVDIDGFVYLKNIHTDSMCLKVHDSCIREVTVDVKF